MFSKIPIYSLTLLITLFGQIPVVNAERDNQSNQTQQQTNIIRMVNFEPPAGQGAPDSTAAGASRTSCPSQNLSEQKPALSLKALVPSTTQQLPTVKEHPSLFIYIPPTSRSAIFFQIKDEQGTIIYQSLQAIDAPEGQILPLNMPENSPLLEIGQNYQWSVFLLCKYDPVAIDYDVESLEESYDLMNEPWVIGSITRIESPANLSSKQDQIISQELVAEYAQNGLWFETLASLYELIQEQPNNSELKEAWQELLKSQGIEETITEANLGKVTFP